MSWCTVLSRQGYSIRQLAKAPVNYKGALNLQQRCVHDSLALASPRMNHRHSSGIEIPHFSSFRGASRTIKKTIFLQRHGQAHHNVNAEPMREGGCTYEEFLEQMRIDDALDSDLTSKGKQQARSIQVLLDFVCLFGYLYLSQSLLESLFCAPHVGNLL